MYTWFIVFNATEHEGDGLEGTESPHSEHVFWSLDLDNILWLCWLREWRGDMINVIPPTNKLSRAKEDDSNPFLEDLPTSQQPKDWTWGSMVQRAWSQLASCKGSRRVEGVHTTSQ